MDCSRGFLSFLVLFSFFTIACGNVGNSKAVTARAELRIYSPTRSDGYKETFEFGPSREPNAYSDVVLRGLGYKGCAVFLASGEERKGKIQKCRNWKNRFRLGLEWIGQIRN